MPVLSCQNSEIFYQIAGPENGPLLVFANSLGTDLHVWDPLLPHLPKDLRILRYDKRGHGQSTATAEFTMEDLVDDAIALIEHLGANHVIFVGLSIGGMIGLGLCAQRPDLVKGFVLMDSAAKIGTETFWNERIRTIEQNGIEAISESLMTRWFTADFIAAGKAKPWQAMVNATSLAGYIGCCRAIAQTDFSAAAEKLRLPVLALAGDQDGATPPELVEQTAALIDSADFKLIANAAHIPGVEQPEETARLIGEFIEGLK